jgi:hypothetical protein
MAKELPYFRFTPQEWQNGDIGLESYEMKGLFIDICSYYWLRDCSLTLAMLEKKFSTSRALIGELIELLIIEWNDETDFLQINFLNNQYDMLSKKRGIRQEAGRSGGLKKSSNARSLLKQKSSYKDKDKDKDKDKNISTKTFYKNQLLLPTDKKGEYQFFIDILFGKNELSRELTAVLKLRDQVSIKQFEKLIDLKNKHKKSIAEILLKMENDPKYLKGKVSLYLTISNWIKNPY